MKKILLITAVILLAVSCHKEPYLDSDNEYLVYTSPGKDVTFTSFRTFDLADSLLRAPSRNIRSPTMPLL